jgi:hypothetical protein
MNPEVGLVKYVETEPFLRGHVTKCIAYRSGMQCEQQLPTVPLTMQTPSFTVVSGLQPAD